MKKFILLMFSLFIIRGQAEEGMWLLDQLDQLDLEQMGLEIDIARVHHPDRVSLSNAIVWLQTLRDWKKLHVHVHAPSR